MSTCALFLHSDFTDTLYLPIKQVYFDQNIAGTKKEEYALASLMAILSRHTPRMVILDVSYSDA